MNRGVLVYCPVKNGGLEPVGPELLGQGRLLANQLGEPLYGMLIGSGVGETAVAACHLGADQIFVVNRPELAQYTAGAFSDAMELVIQTARPSIALFGATTESRDVAARLAARLGTGLTADCTALTIEPGTNLLLQTRPAYGGNVLATIVCNTRPQMATVRPGVFEVPRPGISSPHAKLVDLSADVKFRPSGLEVLSTEPLPLANRALRAASVVVACGRGVKNQSGVALAERLAKALGGEIAASRGAVESGLFPRERQVGQTGQTIRPRLYIACGLSGAVQHLAGIQEVPRIIAINEDPNAPIFAAADYGICADLFDVLPRLTDMILRGKET